MFTSPAKSFCTASLGPVLRARSQAHSTSKRVSVQRNIRLRQQQQQQQQQQKQQQQHRPQQQQQQQQQRWRRNFTSRSRKKIAEVRLEKFSDRNLIGHQRHKFRENKLFLINLSFFVKNLIVVIACLCRRCRLCRRRRRRHRCCCCIIAVVNRVAFGFFDTYVVEAVDVHVVAKVVIVFVVEKDLIFKPLRKSIF